MCLNQDQTLTIPFAMWYKLIMKDAFWQLLWRFISAGAGFFVITLMSPYLWPLRYGDYSTILKYFAIWSALADFGLYVIALKDLWKIKHEQETSWQWSENLALYYSKFVSSRLIVAVVVYTVALILAYLIPAYTANPYIAIGLPLGMFFSASFVASGITQLPFQLYRKMHHVTIAMILARTTQLAVLVLTILVRFPGASVSFSENPDSSALWAFWLILFSVVCSALMQCLYTLRQWWAILPLRFHIDWKFSRSLIQRNAQYGVAYFMSSFHTLIVLILLSIMYPTIQWYTYVGIRWLALSFVEMLLIIPPSIANGVMHKSAHYSLQQKQASYGNLMVLMVRIAWLIGIVLTLYSQDIISIVAWSKYLTTSTAIGSDILLPWFGIVLVLNFIKQVMNYIFVSTELHNNLLRVNGRGVLIGTSIWWILIRHGNILGWLMTQILLEILFVWWSLWVASHHKILPTIPRQVAMRLGAIMLAIWIWTRYVVQLLQPYHSIGLSIASWAICVWLVSTFSRTSLTHLMKGLTHDEVT